MVHDSGSAVGHSPCGEKKLSEVNDIYTQYYRQVKVLLLLLFQGTGRRKIGIAESRRTVEEACRYN